MAQKLYTQTILKKTLAVPASCNVKGKLRDNILKILRKEVEGRCINVGYIEPGSIQIKGYTTPKCDMTHFEGVSFTEVNYSANVCYPRRYQVYEAEVFSRNIFGMTLKTGPLNIVVRLGQSVAMPKNANKGQRVKVEVETSMFEVGGDSINVVARFYTGEKKGGEKKIPVTEEKKVAKELTFEDEELDEGDEDIDEDTSEEETSVSSDTDGEEETDEEEESDEDTEDGGTDAGED